jgi:hypothetical protein
MVATFDGLPSAKKTDDSANKNDGIIQIKASQLNPNKEPISFLETDITNKDEKPPESMQKYILEFFLNTRWLWR